MTGTGRWKVSAKIQQLLNTLKRPKRRPLPEFYEDDDIELEIAANPKDPNAPKPEGSSMTPAIGEQLVVSYMLYKCNWWTNTEFMCFLGIQTRFPHFLFSHQISHSS